MKKMIALAVVLVLCVAIAVPVAAAEDVFVPSITYKGGPEYGIAVLQEDANEEDVSGCVIVTSIEQARDKVTDITQDERDLLIDVYEKLDEGTMTLPVSGDYVIRELVDVSFKYGGCRVIPEHNQKDQKLKEEKVVLKMTFDLGVEKDTELAVMTYIDDEWEEIVSVENNGDGTVTCIFEDICPVAFVVLN